MSKSYVHWTLVKDTKIIRLKQRWIRRHSHPTKISTAQNHKQSEEHPSSTEQNLHPCSHQSMYNNIKWSCWNLFVSNRAGAMCVIDALQTVCVKHSSFQTRQVCFHHFFLLANLQHLWKQRFAISGTTQQAAPLDFKSKLRQMWWVEMLWAVVLMLWMCQKPNRFRNDRIINNVN